VSRITAARVTLERLKEDQTRKRSEMIEACEAYATATAKVVSAAEFVERLEEAPQ
jgi:hypothetical protein